MIEDGYNDINAMRRKILKLKRELTQLREDRRVLAQYVNFIDQYFGATEEEGCLIWMNCDNEVLCEHGELSDAVDASGALGRAQG